jgi:excinuclease UvrABC ATPase subunit
MYILCQVLKALKIGGVIIAGGTPEKVAKNKKNPVGVYIKKMLLN